MFYFQRTEIRSYKLDATRERTLCVCVQRFNIDKSARHKAYKWPKHIWSMKSNMFTILIVSRHYSQLRNKNWWLFSLLLFLLLLTAAAAAAVVVLVCYVVCQLLWIWSGTRVYTKKTPTFQQNHTWFARAIQYIEVQTWQIWMQFLHVQTVNM